MVNDLSKRTGATAHRTPFIVPLDGPDTKCTAVTREQVMITTDGFSLPTGIEPVSRERRASVLPEYFAAT